MKPLEKKQYNTDLSFCFNPENKKKSEQIIKKYPPERKASAVLPLLDLAQRQNDGWLSIPAIEYVSNLLEMPYIKVYEVATFYSMFNLQPVGEYFIQVCRTTPCWLSNSDSLSAKCKEKLGVEKKKVTPDGKFSHTEVECLGACVNAPVVQINDDFFEDLTPQILEKIIDDISKGKKVKPGSYKNSKP